MNLGYISRVIRGLSLDRIDECASRCAAASGKSKALILADMAFCTARFGAGFHDYMIFEFYNMTNAERATYMTRMKNKDFMSRMNDPVNSEIFDDKSRFDTIFKDFLGRDILVLAGAGAEDVKGFIAGKEFIIAKPNEGECGHGIEKIELSQFATPDDAAAYILDPEKGFGVLEDLVIQHPEMSRLYPHSVNTMRMATLVVGDRAHCLYAVLKTGNNGKFVDNLENGGFACHVDDETGVVIGPAHTTELNLAEAHPATGVAFVGFKIPYFQEAKQLVEKAAMLVPTVRYIGWDVCITENGPAIIEGNNYAAYDFPQLPDYSQHHEGLLARLRAVGADI